MEEKEMIEVQQEVESFVDAHKSKHISFEDILYLKRLLGGG